MAREEGAPHAAVHLQAKSLDFERQDAHVGNHINELRGAPEGDEHRIVGDTHGPLHRAAPFGQVRVLLLDGVARRRLRRAWLARSHSALSSGARWVV